MLTTLEQLKVSLQAVKRYINKVLPTKVSELQNDSGYLTQHQDISGKANTSDLATVAISGDYDDLSNKPTIATPDWNAAQGQSGYIDNKPNIRQGTDTNHTAVAEGGGTTASGVYSHTEGAGTMASGDYSHAEGQNTTASNYYCHAEGQSTTASGTASHVEGQGSVASGQASHAEGITTTASGVMSHTEGWGTIAPSVYQHVQGKNNVVDNNNTYAHIVGNGTDNSNRSNAHTLDWYGNGWYAGKLTVGTAPANNMDVATKKYVDDNSIDESTLVKKTDYATTSAFGIMKVQSGQGLDLTNGLLKLAPADATDIKGGSNGWKPLTPLRQDASVFYGLAKAAGDTTQALSANSVGTYTTEAKTAIKSMLGVTDTPPEIFIGSTIPSGYTVYIDPDGSTVVGEGVSF